MKQTNSTAQTRLWRSVNYVLTRQGFFWIGFKGNCWRSDLKLSITFHCDKDRKKKVFCQRCTMVDPLYNKVYLCEQNLSDKDDLQHVVVVVVIGPPWTIWRLVRDKLRKSVKLCLDGLSQTTTDDHHNPWRHNLFSHIGIKVLMIFVILQRRHLIQISKIKRPLLRNQKKKKKK